MLCTCNGGSQETATTVIGFFPSSWVWWCLASKNPGPSPTVRTCVGLRTIRNHISVSCREGGNVIPRWLQLPGTTNEAGSKAPAVSAPSFWVTGLHVETTAMNAAPSLFALPLEILVRIFGLLKGRQIARCGTVCSYFKRVIETSVVLQYSIKLDMFGYADVLGSVDAPAVPATRVNQLERHIDAWNSLDWVETRIDAASRGNGSDVLCQGILATFDLKSVHCIQLPRLVRDILFRRWTLDDFVFPIHEIEIDPSNNLLVVLSSEWLYRDRQDVNALHLRTLSDNSPHPRAISHILLSVPTDLSYPVVRVMGRLLGVTARFRGKLRLDIWDWTTGQIMTVLDMRDADAFIRSRCTFEFLSATSIVVAQQGALEVYQICIETPGAPPDHTASFTMPHQYCSTLWIIGSPRLSRGIDHGDLSDRSPFLSPSFPLAEDTYYLRINWDVHDSTGILTLQFHVPLSSLRRTPRYPDPLAIPWETWSKDVCFPHNFQNNYGISGGRLICFALEASSLCHLSVFDLNRSRAGRLGMTSTDPQTDYTLFPAIKPDLWRRDDITMKRPDPVYLASRSFNLGHFVGCPSMVCDEEHIIFRGLECPVRVATDGDDDGAEPVPVPKLIILTMQ